MVPANAGEGVDGWDVSGVSSCVVGFVGKMPAPLAYQPFWLLYASVHSHVFWNIPWTISSRPIGNG